jgi:hypothetical protein
LSSLDSIEIPRDVRFINGCAFVQAHLSSISLEAGHDPLVIENDFLIDIVDHRLIRNFSRSCHIEIMITVEIVGSSCFSL